ncbi:TetR/AcrR family transcriptional regulator [Acinetobacter sp. ANC 4648]|uniref:TetR/AcrR family transcriptional regulator n=1 Tax=Acinetobacter sp. ANC 4648 TaxID=1977875 RepID=UPI000A334FDC|nr:TetR/AcrR family transcriptional regulator [Acinetobacter sp. ANC 4648]OTG85119.1 TetR family transcriptional regulator [Acinetobacter sp. ANC 4648]
MTDLESAAELLSVDRESKRKRGRPKCFNEQEALQKAMLLFWEYGYESTSISDLTQSLNITAPSLYSSFGDKSQLFHRCLEYYLEHEACPIERIFQEAKTAKVAFELYLYENVQRLVQAHKPTGCMLVVATMNCSEQNHAIQNELLLKRQKTKQKLFERLTQGVQDGDLSTQVDLVEMTDFYTTVIQGLTLQARDGVMKEQLNQVVRHAMKSWILFE